MKNLFLEKSYQPFLFLALVAVCIAVFFKGAHPDSIFDVSIYNTDFEISTSRIWFFYTAYLFLLAFIYFVISRTKLKTKKWLILSHYLFLVLFLVFFALFGSFTNPGVEKLMAGIPLTTLITLYGILFLADVVFFILGIVFLFINLLSLRSKKS